jgi:hypothetical protein
MIDTREFHEEREDITTKDLDNLRANGTTLMLSQWSILRYRLRSGTVLP